MTVTVKDVARESGLSVSSVIHILGGRHHRYRPETCERVREVAARLGYRRNSSARAMRRGKFDCVALLMSAEADATLLRQAALEGICDELAKHGMHLNVARFPESELVDDQLIPKMLREWMADGILVAFAMHIPPRMEELIASSRLPCVWMRSRRESNCVYLDEMGAAEKSVAYLSGLGHQHIAFADYTYGTENLHEAHSGVRDFEAGYRTAMKKVGRSPTIIREEKRVERSDRVGRFRKLFASPECPTALIAYPSTVWPAVMAAVASGLRIPEDLSILAASSEHEDTFGIRLTTMAVSEYEVGRQSAALIVNRIRNPKQSLPAVAVPFVLHEGVSCGPPKGV